MGSQQLTSKSTTPTSRFINLQNEIRYRVSCSYIPCWSSCWTHGIAWEYLVGHLLAELLVVSPLCKTGRARPFIGRVLPTRSAALDGAAMDGVLWLDQYKCLRINKTKAKMIPTN